MYKLRLGVSVSGLYGTNLNKNFEHQIKKLKKLGFDSIDLDITGCWRQDVFEKRIYEFGSYMQVLKENDMFLNGIHVPFGGYLDISSRNEELRQSSLALAVKIFDALDKYNPNCYIFHSSNEPITDEERPKLLDKLVDSLKYLRSKTSTMICIENLPRSCLLNTAKEVKELISRVENINVCLDANHFLQEKTEDAILEIGNVIGTLHISDHDYIDEKHWLPYQGLIAWQQVISSLDKIGYNGVFTYEVSANYDYEQIKDNFDQIFDTYNK